MLLSLRKLLYYGVACMVFSDLTGCFALKKCNCKESNYWGTYGAVSESEWDITVRIKRGGDAIVTHETWLAGEQENSEKHTYYARWNSECNLIKILYDSGEVDRLVFSNSVPAAEFGKDGTFPGLIWVDSIDADHGILWKVILWKKPFKF